MNTSDEACIGGAGGAFSGSAKYAGHKISIDCRKSASVPFPNDLAQLVSSEPSTAFPPQEYPGARLLHSNARLPAVPDHTDRLHRQSSHQPVRMSRSEPQRQMAAPRVADNKSLRPAESIEHRDRIPR